ncbi:Annexin A4 [Phlyctochytrium planicorne]|nr:Annexin A4 [Phlyctochytrium planicorne]
MRANADPEDGAVDVEYMIMDEEYGNDDLESQPGLEEQEMYAHDQHENESHHHDLHVQEAQFESDEEAEEVVFNVQNTKGNPIVVPARKRLYRNINQEEIYNIEDVNVQRRQENQPTIIIVPATPASTSILSLNAANQTGITPIIGAGIAFAAVTIAVGAIALNRRGKRADIISTAPAGKKPSVSRYNSSSKLEAQIKTSTGPAAHTALVGAKKETSANASPSVKKKKEEPILMDRISASPVSRRTSINDKRGSVDGSSDWPSLSRKQSLAMASVERRISGGPTKIEERHEEEEQGRKEIQKKDENVEAGSMRRLSTRSRTASEKIQISNKAEDTRNIENGNESDSDGEITKEREQKRDQQNSSSDVRELKRAPTVTDDAKAEAKAIVESLKLLKDDNPEVVRLLYKKTPQQMEELSKAAKTLLGGSFEEELGTFCSSDVKKVLIGLVMNPLDYDAFCIEEAVKGVGCDEDALIEILVGRTNADIEGIKQAYKARFNKDLKDVLASELHGNLKRLFKIIIQGERDESQRTLDIEADVEELYKAGEGRLGTDELAFIQILTGRTETHLRKLFFEYKMKHKKCLEDVVKKEFHGDLERALLAIVRSTDNKPHFIATQFEKSMKGLGHNHSKLIRLVVRNRHPEVMRQIKMEYLVEYTKSLHERIKEETTGLYQKCLLEIVLP